MDKETYLIFYNVEGSVSHLRNLLNMKADKYYCLGNLVKKEITYGSDLEDSFECLKVFREKSNAVLFKGEAERNLLNLINNSQTNKDESKENKYKDLISRLFDKQYLETMQTARTGSSIKAAGIYFMPKPPTDYAREKDFGEEWSNLDQSLKEKNKSEACSLDMDEFYQLYEGGAESLINYFYWSRDYSNHKFFFIGNRLENTLWKKNLVELSLFRSEIDAMQITRMKLDQKEGPFLITPGSAKYGFFCRFTMPNMELELYSEPDLRETREMKKLGFTKKKLP